MQPRDYAERMDDLIDRVFERRRARARTIVAGVVVCVVVVCLTVWAVVG